MPSYLQDTDILLEWSSDPLSDTTPTYTAVDPSEIRALEWWAGVDEEGNTPEPGGLVVRFKNIGRKWEPLFGSNLIDTQQRLRLTVGGVQEGVFFITDFELEFPSGRSYSEVVVSCADGWEVLEQDALPGLDPPDAQSYEDVIQALEPWGYWRLGEPEGTRAVAVFRKFKKTVHRGGKTVRRKVRRRVGTRYVTRAETGGVAGPSGVYKNTPLLGQPGAILGDLDTSVLFRTANSERVRFNVDNSDMIERNRLTAIAWVQPVSSVPMFSSDRAVISGPLDASSSPVFRLAHADDDNWYWTIRGTDDNDHTVSAPIEKDVWHMIAGVWDGNNLEIYDDGVLANTAAYPGIKLKQGTAGAMFIAVANASLDGPFDGYIDEVAVIERALSADEIASIYTAGTDRGWPEQTAGERIADICGDIDLWNTSSIQTAGRDVIPQMKAGQSRTEEIAETMHAEGPRTLFFFNGDGDPVYLGHEWQATATAYNTVQATFADPDSGAGIRYENVELVYDHETFNEIVASREGGSEVVVEDATAQAQRGRRVRTEETDLLLTEDAYVESLAAHVLDRYKAPAKRPVSMTVDGSHALEQIQTLDIGHRVRVRKAGETGDPTDRVVNIIRKHKAIDQNRNLVCVYRFDRGFDGADGYWHLGAAGFSELGTTTTIAG